MYVNLLDMENYKVFNLVMLIVTLILVLVAIHINVEENDPDDEDNYDIDIYFLRYEMDKVFWAEYVFLNIMFIATLLFLVNNNIHYALTGVAVIMLFGAVVDFKFKLVPDTVTLLILALSAWFIYDAGLGWMYAVHSLCMAVSLVLLLLIVSIFTGGGIGGGDMKLLGALTFLLGLEGMYTYLCILLIIAVFMVTLQKLLFKGYGVAMFPSFAVSFIIHLLYGDIIYTLYIEGQLFDLMGVL